ncbi:ABC transporter permease [Tessaracoccus sp. MC1865]|uniref:ABC transporter permease n=1 Tax=Tessaracoccus sp. MC1865 TaxID=2760310 RepID=UPI0016040F9A|nr:ABC transporter permease [Tessaracoccus sp. MC1865]MBB1482918.1 ABC transporter permease [Tessaracoccus sp. MC1865]QTO37643.1 ABC transporter permease [Tessaracoccus sp. MC1865]
MSETGPEVGQPAAAPDPATADAAPARKRITIPEMAALIGVLAVLIVFFSVASPFFLSANNLLNILTAIAVTGILAAPGTLLLIAGQVDLSVGAATALCGIVLAVLTPTLGLPVAVLTTIATGCIIGLINGVLVTVVGLNSLIVTLGGLAAFRGVAFLLGDGQTVIMPNFGYLGTARPLGVPMPVVVLLAFMAVVYVVLRYTVFGRNIYAIGANPVAARLVGIPSRRTIFLAFVASGVAMATAGMILTSQLGAAVPNAALGMELMVVTAIVLGGASLSGGRGSVLGTLLGLVIIGVLNNGLILMNVSSYWQQVANGVLLVAAVSFDRLRERFSPA